ncbi:MAG TPA: ShlB/FhaC/HecB family hemolysin secretion/activation protein, partial [Opitutus sp.]|nr:ShlB/FhaC/HecB family hemolysin secretion/activation protein [Opitutus sp.]
YFRPGQIQAAAPSLAEGQLVNFNDVPRDIIALNQNPDRRVTPALAAGATPGSVDVDLNVKDAFPLHASVELNNRRSANTTALRVNATVSDNNLFQRGDTAGLSFQTAPERSSDAKVLSAYYLTRTPGGTTFMLQGTKQDSDVSTLGGVAVAGRGESVGARAIFRLPASKSIYQSASLGFDYKQYDQTLNVAGSKLVAPVTYFPITAGYSATLVTEHAVSEAGANVTLHVRGLGSSPAAFDARRYKADGSFIYLRVDASQTRTLPHDWKLVGRAQAQLASGALLDSEQFSGGGLGTVRGYLESEAVGDNAVTGSLELQTPSLAPLIGTKVNEWRFYAFTDGAVLTLFDPLPQQKAHFYLASFGVGTRLRFDEHFNGSLDAGLPQYEQIETKPNDLHLTFRLWAEF